VSKGAFRRGVAESHCRVLSLADKFKAPVIDNNDRLPRKYFDRTKYYPLSNKYQTDVAMIELKWIRQLYLRNGTTP